MEPRSCFASGCAPRAGQPVRLFLMSLAMLVSSTLAGATDFNSAFEEGWDAYQSGRYRIAMQHWLPLAEQGDANAQLNIGLLYESGRGTDADPVQAAYWYRQSAEYGLAAAQYNLGLMYRDGNGVEQDQGVARGWFERAAAQGLQAARALLETAPAPLDGSPDTDENTFLNSLENTSTGTAWAVTGGYAVTSDHVIADATHVDLYDVNGKRYTATIVLRDDLNDIALMRIESMDEMPPALPLAGNRIRAGIDVFTLGFPRVDILGRTPKLSTGIISAINGYRDDPTSYQTSVQIQPGNSGGPLLNMNGEVVGIMAAMLGDQSGTSSPQPGLSYAVKVEKIHAALQALPSRESAGAQLPPTPAGLADLAERVQDAVLLVVATP